WESEKDELRTRHEKQKSESGCNGCKATARPSNQEGNTAISIFPLFLPRDCKTRANSITRQITIYEIDNTPLPQQYRGWMHSTVNQLRQHADHYAKQREHARGLRL